MSPRLSIIVPAYNEAERLPPALDDMLQYLRNSQDTFEIIVVNDGSSDNTARVVEDYARQHTALKLINFERNKGKGAAVQAGMLAAAGDMLLFCDADGSTPFIEIEKLLRQLVAGSDVAIGSRALQAENTRVETSLHRKALGRIFNLAMNLLVLPGIADTQCGFKLFKRNAGLFLFSHQKSTGFAFDLEILYLAKKAGISVAEVPINWHNVPGSKVNLLLDSMKMFRDGLKAHLWHRRVSRRDYELFLTSSAEFSK